MEVAIGKQINVGSPAPERISRWWNDSKMHLEGLIDNIAYSLDKAVVPAVTKALVGRANYGGVLLPYLALLNEEKGSVARIGVIPRENGIEVVGDYTANDSDLREALDIVSEWIAGKYRAVVPPDYLVITGPAQIP